ncbi:uncharacterized protein LOC112681329 [Sipha flava]|jgi:hypothetical protein|uniref:Uncharacterized protein LOC112681329 n=1 Tax=Sipha flava TaxID=143950 RepID=A0A8B8FAF7_9HEMI|nr:uncharacterized protein LOC112681329 [Sipha flava]
MGLDETQAKVLVDLKRKRGVVKGSLTRVRTFISKFDPRNDAITLLEFRQEELPQITKKFDKIQCEIELIDLDNPEEAEAERESFEKEYYSIRSEMQEIINLEKSHNSSMQNASISATIQPPRALLAPISLPKFNGNILEWESFFDCFKVLVHHEDTYSAAQKFSYLRSVLSGQALDVVKGIPMTETNYNVAIKKLLHRYDNKSLIIQSHIRSILDVPPVKPGSSKDLQELHSLVTNHVAVLEALGQPVEHWDAWLITIILRKLDISTIHQWQLRHANTELPKFIEIEKFLAGRCVAFESTEPWFSTTEDNDLKTASKTTNLKKTNLTQYSKKSLLAAKDLSEDKCVCCSDVHKLFMCTKFKEMPVNKRVTLVRETRLCFNCFSSFHMADKCKSKYSCLKCNRKHNTLLHYETQFDTSESKSISDINHGKNPQSTASCSSTSLIAHNSNGHVFLPTVIVSVSDSHGTERKCRAILDSGSQINFVSKRLANMLQLPRQKVSLPVSGIGANQVQSVSSISIKIKSRVNQFEIELVCHVLPVIIKNMPCCSIPMEG